MHSKNTFPSERFYRNIFYIIMALGTHIAVLEINQRVTRFMFSTSTTHPTRTSCNKFQSAFVTREHRACWFEKMSWCPREKELTVAAAANYNTQRAIGRKIALRDYRSRNLSYERRPIVDTKGTGKNDLHQAVTLAPAALEQSLRAPLERDVVTQPRACLII